MRPRVYGGNSMYRQGEEGSAKETGQGRSTEEEDNELVRGEEEHSQLETKWVDGRGRGRGRGVV